MAVSRKTLPAQGNGTPPVLSAEAAIVGENLKSEFQKIEAAWKKAEDLLALTHCPTDVKVRVGSGSAGCDVDNPYAYYSVFLAYCKQKSGWKVCWIRETEYTGMPASGNVDDNFEVECRPIVEWPVDIRLEGFEHFTKLYAEVLTVAKEFVPKIDKAVKKFEGTLELIDL
jgi:hypothetical protein